MALSTTLVVIAFATALKDIVEVATNIRDAFEKVPQNYRNVLDIASDILQTARKMHKLYGERKEVFEMAPDLQESMHDLYHEMTIVHQKCRRLIPPVAERKRDRFKIAFYSFWNRKKVESLVLELKNHIDGCYKQFALLSTMRIEATVNKIAHVLSTVVNAQSYSKEDYLSDRSSPSSAQLFQFAHTNSTPMTWMHETIPVHDLSKAYLRRELGTIEKSLGHLASRWSRNPTISFQVPPLRMTWSLEQLPVSGTVFHQVMVIQAFRLQSILHSADISTISVISSEISSMSALLGDSGMYQDALSVRRWGVNFWRHIASILPAKNAWAQLAQQLTNLSMCYQNIRDKDQAYATSQEALDVIHRILDESNSPQLQELIARNLSIPANNLPSSTPVNAIELASRAVGTLESALKVGSISASFMSVTGTNTGSLRKFSSPNVLNVTDIPPGTSDDSLFTYSSLLLNLSTLQQNWGYASDALATKKRALAILHFLSSKYPQSRRLLQNIATTSFILCGHTYCAINTVVENLAYARECIDIYRKLLQKDESSQHLLLLSSALLSYKQVLLSAGKLHDADIIYREMMSLAESASQKYLDLKLPSEIEGDYHYHLAITHRSARRIPDAIYAAQNAVAQYSALGFTDPAQNPLKHIKALNMLCELFCSSGQYHSALMEGYKALKIIDNARERSTTAFTEQYVKLFDDIMEVLENQSEPNALPKATEIIVRFQALFRSKSTWSTSLIRLPVAYMTILKNNRMFDQAISFAHDFLTTWKDAYGTLNDVKFAYPYLQCLKARSDTLKDQGKTSEALECNTQAIDFAQKHTHPDNSPLMHYLWRGITNAQVYLLCDAGRYGEALEFSHALMKSYRDSGADVESQITGLHCLGLAQIYNCIPHEAIHTATEAVSRCRSEISKGKTYALSWLYISLVALADALFDNGQVDEALVCMDEARDAIRNALQSNAALRKSSSDAAYQIISSRTARMLFVKGEYLKAKDLMIEIIDYEKGLFAADRFVFRRLARSLRFSGIVFCCAGQHEEGVASSTKCSELMAEFSLSHPTFAQEVQLMLDMERRRVMWKMIQTSAKSTLDCTHQDDIFREFFYFVQ